MSAGGRTRGSPLRSGSLSRRIFALAGGSTLFAVAAGTLFVFGAEATRRELSEATQDFILELRIADDVMRGVSRQFAVVSAYPYGDGGALDREFTESGQAVYEGIRRYLFEDLGLEERLQVERIREAHQQMEVQALRAAELHRRGEAAAADEARRLSLEHAFDLLEELDGFLAMRESDVADLAESQARALRVVVGVGGLLAFLIVAGSLVFAWQLQKRVTGPLGELAQATHRITEGDVAARAPTGYDSEIADLATAFNVMAERVARSRADLERRNQELSDALAQVGTAQAELVHAEKLSAMGRMSAGIAHELNNPLATVLGSSELLLHRIQDGDVPPAEELRREYVEPIHADALRARTLVRSMLDFARPSDGGAGPVPLRRTVEVATSLIGHAYVAAGLELRVGRIPDVDVVAQGERLQEAILNILSNALDAMAPRGHGTLVVAGTVEDGAATLRFDDDGPGFPDPERVFEPFYTTKAPGAGTGLGLALAARLLEACGGGIHAENRAEGGACLTLRLRLAGPVRDGTRPAPEAPAVPPRVVTPPSEDRPPRVLILEDETHLRRLHERMLKRFGLAYDVAGDTDEARTLLAEHAYDAVLSDVKMPGESGMDFYRWLRESHPALAARLVFVTGDMGAPELDGLGGARPEMFLRKPFGVDEYADCLARLLEGRWTPPGA